MRVRALGPGSSRFTTLRLPEVSARLSRYRLGASDRTNPAPGPHAQSQPQMLRPPRSGLCAQT
eukprot:CAMPEP_0170436130 /NCGR_PEP_ID=MMETSP0117_2-20130122/43978_1 /TAXON_ID=400756 /ORGANISM="Durinskia baltica, Strain CSIRO CS-38" /LENGTH=62 /DNA_ID=CAMNT_0010696147 /DNA_START=77 /DNA_END=261 /DNA_ORIENTATION=-